MLRRAGGRGVVLAVALAGVALLSACAVTFADEASHRYDEGESIAVWLNKIGPYHNPHETYPYYALPFCKPATELSPRRKFMSLGEILEGYDFVNSDLDVRFRKDTPRTSLCVMSLNPESAQQLRYAVSNHYWYQMYIDELPVWGMVGEIVASGEFLEELEKDTTHGHQALGSNVFVYSHKSFSVWYKDDRVVEVSLTSENAVPITDDLDMEMTYSVKWQETDADFENRFDKYLDYSFFEHQIHWFSIFNSFMVVLFLCGLVGLILLRTLKSDYARYMRDEEELDALDRGAGDESGWKMIHGDVFRRPDRPMLLAALLGTSAQLGTMTLLVTLVAIARSLYVETGAITTAVVILFSLTAIVNGYVSGAYYSRQYHPNPAPDWVRAALLSSVLFPGAVFLLMAGLNFIAVAYSTVNSVPITTTLSMLAIWLFVSLPLHLGGTILGRNWSGSRALPCRVSVLPRQVPPKPWYTEPWLLIPATGLLPFGSIFIEMYFVFASFWNYKFYYVYGFLLLVLFILLLVCSCVTIVATYFLLNAEDWRWQWVSFLAAASTGGYVYVFSLYYFLFKTNMTGLLQTAFFFGYTAVFSAGVAVFCGGIGTLAASTFVHHIYRSIKVE